MGKPFGSIPQIPSLGSTPAGNPASGFEFLYFKSSDGNLYRKDSSGTETVIGGGGGSAEPAGVIKSFAGIITPSGYLACDGSAVSRTTYATLWQAVSFQFIATITAGSPNLTSVSMSRGALADIQPGMPISGTGIPAGTTVLSVNTGTSTIVMSANSAGVSGSISFNVAPFGVGDGSTTFNLPDGRVRMLVGAGTNAILGASQGLTESTRASSFSHAHVHTASSSETAVSAGTPAGSLSSVSAGTPAGSLSSDSAGTPDGTLSSVSAGTPVGNNGTTSAGTPAGSISSVSAGTPSISVSVAAHADHQHWTAAATTGSVGDHGHTIPGATTAGVSVPNSGTGSQLVTGRGAFDGHNHGNATANGGHNHSVPSTWSSSTDSTLTHTVTTGTSSLPGHSHTFTGSALAAHDHTFTGSALPGHAHSFTGTAMGVHTHAFTGSALAGHTHTFTGTALSTHLHAITTTVDSAASDVHPYLAVAYIIKT